MTTVSIPADPDLVTCLERMLSGSPYPHSTGPIAVLTATAIAAGMELPPLDLADAIDNLSWPDEEELQITLFPGATDTLQALFHRVSMAMPIGRRPPRLDDAAIVAGCLAIYCRQPYRPDTPALHLG